MKVWKILATGALAVAIGAVPVSAGTVKRLVFKLSDSVPDANAGSSGYADAVNTWLNAGGFNMGVLNATSLLNNGIDYKDSWVDDATNWATVQGVHVGYYSGGALRAFAEFSPVGGKNGFFNQGNITSSSWTDLGLVHNIFSIPGDAGIDRHWFANRNYGGCSIDVGHMVVLDRRTSAYPCNWENNRTNSVGDPTRAFLYSALTVNQNWNQQIGIADVFAVHVKLDVPMNPIPVPATLPLILTGLGGLALFRRRLG